MAKDPNIAAANEIYNIARKDADNDMAALKGEVAALQHEAHALGILQKIKYDQKHNEMLKYVVLFQVKQSKSYKKGGMSWADFCSAMGEQVRSVDRALEDLRPIVNSFSDSLSNLAGVPFNKIRYLGREMSSELVKVSKNELIIDGAQIPLTPDNKDEIEAAIDAMRDTHQAEQKALSTRLEKLEKNKDKVIAEETKALSCERDALVKENVRLKAFDPGEKDHTWSVEQMTAVRDAAVSFTAAVRKFSMDERIADDMHVQGQVEALLAETDKYFRSLRQDWDETFNTYDEV
jgi:hypothetical protein